MFARPQDLADRMSAAPQPKTFTLPVDAARLKAREILNEFPRAGYMAALSALGTGDYKASQGHAEAFLKRFARHELTAEVLFIGGEAYVGAAVPDPAGVRYRAHTAKPYAPATGGCERLIKAVFGRHLSTTL